MVSHHRYEGGWVEVICGSMFSGKTEELIRRVKRAVIAKQKVQVFKPRLDIRYAHKKVTSHDGVNFHATPVLKATDILERLDPDTEVVAIDEAQFLDWSISEVCAELANRGLRVIVAGLDMDFRINSKPAAYDDPVILVGADEVYEARCRVCHQVPRSEEEE
jgi:thymidine kinase